MLAPADGTASGHEGSKKPKGIPIKGYATLRQRLSGQQVLVFEAATGRGIDEAFLAARRRLASRIRVRRGGAMLQEYELAVQSDSVRKLSCILRHHDDGDASAHRFAACTSGGQRLSS